MYVEGVGQKSGPCTATFNDLLCLNVSNTQNKICKFLYKHNCVLNPWYSLGKRLGWAPVPEWMQRQKKNPRSFQKSNPGHPVKQILCIVQQTSDLAG
jgi:hypothetical protein